MEEDAELYRLGDFGGRCRGAVSHRIMHDRKRQYGRGFAACRRRSLTLLRNLQRASPVKRLSSSAHLERCLCVLHDSLLQVCPSTSIGMSLDAAARLDC